MKKKKMTLLDYYTIGDTMCDIRFGRQGVVTRVSSKSVTFKFEFSTKRITLHSLDTLEDFYISHPVV